MAMLQLVVNFINTRIKINEQIKEDKLNEEHL
jgi:hypothetical protein